MTNDVARELDHFHSIVKGLGDSLERVGGSDEENAREVEAAIQLSAQCEE